MEDLLRKKVSMDIFGDDFIDFLIVYELLFPGDLDASVECPYCERIIMGSEKVYWVDQKKKIFKCPDCEEEIKIQ